LGLRYAIKPSRQGWAWTAFEPGGAVAGRGEAASKAVAAACVIRCINRAVAPATPG
jgi:hypothetical protein